MLEILAVYYLCKKIGEVLREKGRNPTWLSGDDGHLLAWWGVFWRICRRNI